MADQPRKAPLRHPSTSVPGERVEEIAYRLYLLRLEPPMTPEESAVRVYLDAKGNVVDNDTKFRRNSKAFHPMVRDMLRVLVDLGMMKVDA